MKDLSIGGVVLLDRIDGQGEQEEIVQPMEVPRLHLLVTILAIIILTIVITIIILASLPSHLFTSGLQVNKGGASTEEEGEEPAPPEPFLYTEEE